ncbi:MAG: hypothetical protein AAFY71_04510 [Bacteroidota bacterium]
MIRSLVCSAILALIVGSMLMNSPLSAQNRMLELTYSGNNLWNPGFRLAIVQDWKEEKTSTLLGKERSTSWSKMITAGLYHDVESHTGFYIQAGALYRNVGEKGWFFDAELSPLGLYRSFLTETWAVDDNGNVSQVRLPGRTYLAPAAALHLGKAGKREWFVGGRVMTLLPYNTYILPLLMIELGVRSPLTSTK